MIIKYLSSYMGFEDFNDDNYFYFLKNLYNGNILKNIIYHEIIIDIHMLNNVKTIDLYIININYYYFDNDLSMIAVKNGLYKKYDIIKSLIKR